MHLADAIQGNALTVNSSRSDRTWHTMRARRGLGGELPEPKIAGRCERSMNGAEESAGVKSVQPEEASLAGINFPCRPSPPRAAKVRP